MKQLAFDFSAAVDPTLDNFAVGRNAELVEHLRALLRERATERFLYVWGARGSGRSHLLKAALAQFEAAGAKARYIACSAETRFPDSSADAIGVDDAERLSETGQIGLFNVYNALLGTGAVLLVSGPAAPAQLDLRADLRTRLASGLVYEVHGLTDAEKAQALAEHAAVRGFTLAPEVCQYLLAHVRRDMATLLAFVDKLDRHSLEAKRPVSLAFVRALLAVHEPAQ